METTFCELKCKEVINIVDGKRLGRIIDIVFDSRCGKILGLVVPSYNRSWNVFRTCDDIFIPYCNVCKIGEDVILVEMILHCQNTKALGKSSYVKATNVQDIPSDKQQEEQNYYNDLKDTKT